MYICICIYVYMYICIYTCMYIHYQTSPCPFTGSHPHTIYLMPTHFSRAHTITLPSTRRATLHCTLQQFLALCARVLSHLQHHRDPRTVVPFADTLCVYVCVSADVLVLFLLQHHHGPRTVVPFVDTLYIYIYTQKYLYTCVCVCLCVFVSLVLHLQRTRDSRAVAV